VGEVVPDDGLWHLRRLAPRAPHDISDIITDDDGGLVAIMHPGVERQSGLRVLREVAIPVSQLIAYVWLPTPGAVGLAGRCCGRATSRGSCGIVACGWT
jgi:hypothetical protein